MKRMHIIPEVTEMPFTIVRENIVSLRTDAVVNPTIPSLTEEDGVNAEIYAAAGRRLAAACGRIGHCEVGRSVLTPGYSLPAKYIIHTVGPVWDGGNGAGTLEAAYRSALELAWKKGCGSVAIPLLSVGGYGCPAEVSLEIALRVIRTFLKNHDLMVMLSLPKWSGPVLRRERLCAVRSYVDKHFRVIAPAAFAAPGVNPAPSAAAGVALPPLAKSAVPGRRRTLADALRNLDESFSRMLLRLIDEKGYTDAEVYKRANMDRKLFSKLRKDSYVPSKSTVLALTVALRLNLDEARDLLARAGYALSPSCKSDVIVEFFISEGIYDFFEINEALFAFGEKPLGV